jgi:DNA polymerase bacteriophage-type
MTNARADLDFETGSLAELVGLRSVGAHRYFEDVSTRAFLFSWSMGDGLVYRWHPGDPDPLLLLNHIAHGGIVVAHNAMFERIAWSFIRDKYSLQHWPELYAAQQRCTMAKGMAMNLPAALDALASVLQLKQQKDTEGSALMKRMAKPRVSKDGAVNWQDDTVSVTRLGEYCDQDIRTEHEIDKAVPDLSPYEQHLWTLDQVINDRGIPVDTSSIMRAVDVVEYAKSRANLDMSELTGSVVKKCSEVKKIVDWINSQGVTCTSFTKGDHEDLIIMGGKSGNTKIAKVVELRRDSSKTSTAKFLKMLECVCNDGRIRGQFQYHGATQTGRWAGRLVQPQNLPRIDYDRDGTSVQFVLWALSAPMSVADTYDIIKMALGSPLRFLSLALRAMIKAESGHVFFGGDFSNIEGRINAWLAGETWKLEAFSAFDAGIGPDLYKLAYSRSFGKPVELIGKGPERQIGKVQELALGYQGGVGALVSMAANYNIKVHELVEPVRAASAAELWGNVLADYAGATDKRGLEQEEWTAAKIVVKNWRGAHPAISASWYELQDAALEAVDNPGRVVSVYSGRVRYLSDKNFLYCQLPSTRVICYPQPHIRHEVTEYVEVNGIWIDCVEFFPYELEIFKALGAKFKRRNRNVVWFYGVDPETKQWKASYLYGGHQCENIVQAVARCILDRAMFAVEKGGYPIVLHAHDEILSHVRKGVGSLKHFESLMNVNEPWLAGLPMAVASFEDERYVK